MEPCLTINGETRRLGAVGGHVTLLEWLRGVGLTGAKEGCAEGECGACAVLVAKPDGESASRWTAINACLVPAASLQDQEVVTAEGLGAPGALHPVQHEMAVRGGSQCGYCTPGFVCSMAAEFYRPDRRPTGSVEPAPAADPGAAGAAETPVLQHAAGPTALAAVPAAEHGPNGFDLHALSGNLCRCTGYRPIRDAAYALGRPAADDRFAQRLARPAPPPAVSDLNSDQGRFVRPPNLDAALRLISDYPGAKVLAGSTDWGVELNIRHSRAALTVGIDRLPELRTVEFGTEWLDIGASIPLSELERNLAGRVPLFADLFPQFASRLIRNGATLGGNLGTGSPIGDATPVLLALDARLVLAAVSGEREVALSEYFTGYRQSVRRPEELIKTIRIPLPVAPVAAFQKIAKRRFDDISSVAVAFALRLHADGLVEDIKIGLGGVAATPLRARSTEAALHGRPWDRATVDEASRVLAAEGTPMSDHRASGAYRAATLGASIRKFFSDNPAPKLQEV